MIWNITTEGLYSAGSLVFITAGLFCAYIRWNHMCKPFCENPDYFYPARKLVTLFFASIVLTFPYILAPMDPAVWIYIRSFCVIYYPVCLTVMIMKYFRLHRRRDDSWLRTAYLASPFVMILALLIPLLAGYGDWMASHQKVILYTVGAVSLVSTIGTVKVLWNLKKEMDRSDTENYSNNEDFPYKFAAKILYAPLLWILIMWTIFITGSRWVKFAVDIVTSCWMIYFLGLILHPQRILRPSVIDDEMEKLEDRKLREIQEIDTSENESSDILPEDDGTPMDMIKDEVLAVILRRFREPHLLKTEVLMDLGNGKRNRASKFISSIGYYSLVNMFRLEYARLYKEAHPDAKQEEIALESGFVSRTAYYKAKRNVERIDTTLTQGIRLAQTDDQL